MRTGKDGVKVVGEHDPSPKCCRQRGLGYGLALTTWVLTTRLSK